MQLTEEGRSMAEQRSRAKMAGLIIGAVLVVGAIVSIFVIDWDTEIEEEAAAVRPLKTMEIGASVTRGIREFPGRVQASQRVDLSFRVSGPLVELPVVDGQEVNEGDLLAAVDPRDYQIALDNISSTVDEAKANLEAMKRGRPEDIEKLKSAVQKAQAALTLAQEEYGAAQTAFDRGGMTRLELSRRLEARDREQANVRNAEEDLRIGERGAREEDMEAAEARIRGLVSQREDAQASLADCSLLAPFSGTVATTFVENFQFVDVREPIMSLQNVDEVDIVVDVAEAILLQVGRNKVEREGYATFDGLPDRRFLLTLKEVSTEADAATQTFRITLTMTPPEDANILPGMSATVTVYRKEVAETDQDTGYAVPIDAVPIDGTGKYYVWKLSQSGDSWKVNRSDVIVGDMVGDAIIVTGGLDKGDRIATAGVHFLQENQQVSLYESAAGDDAS